VDLNRIIVGDTLAFTTSVPGYPASEGWTLKYRLIPRVTGEAITFSSTADGSGHVVNVPAATTAAWVAGEYSWTAYVENAELDSHTVLTGGITLHPDPRVSGAPLDLRTAAEIALAAAKAAFASWSPQATTHSYTIGDRSMTFGSKADIIAVISYWEMEVQRERRAARLRAGLSDPRRTFVRLGRG
jgi:hypothetical protein